MRLMPLISEAMRGAELGWAEIDRIAVGVGPGTFTGLRIGIATARGLSFARKLPLVGVSTLQSLALSGEACPPLSATDSVLAVIDARRGEVFVAGWRIGEVARPEPPLVGAQVMAPSQLARALAKLPRTAGRWLAIGDGAVKFRSNLEDFGAVVPSDGSELHRVTAISHCRLAINLAAGAADSVRPEYLRLPDAELARRTAESP
jgi:tRNA threonylcarbamoyladenosine biosynthesis protein TsaB